MQATDKHPLHRLELLFRPVIELMIATLLILRHAHEDQPLVVERVCLVLHQLHYALLYVFIPQEYLLEELVELGKLLIHVAARDSTTVCFNLLVRQVERFLILGKDLARRLLLDLLEQLFYIRYLSTRNVLGRANESLKLVRLYQVRNLAQLQDESLQVEPTLYNEPHILVAHQLLRRRARYVNPGPIGPNHLPKQEELVVAPVAFKMAFGIQAGDFVHNVLAIEQCWVAECKRRMRLLLCKLFDFEVFHSILEKLRELLVLVAHVNNVRSHLHRLSLLPLNHL